MKKLYRIALLTVALITAVLLLEKTVKVAAAATPTGIKNVVLVHGAFADGSGWDAVAKILVPETVLHRVHRKLRRAS